MTLTPKTEKDGSISDQESATASTENPIEKESVMTQSIDFNGHVPCTPEPPAVFRAYTVQDTINGEPYGESWTEYLGPEAHHGSVSIESSWSADSGIIHFVSNQSQADNGIFTTDELIDLGRMIREVVAATKVSTAENSGIKVCTTCNEGKLLSEYSKHVSNRDGLQTHCKDCAAEYYAKGKGNGDDNA